MTRRTPIASRPFVTTLAIAVAAIGAACSDPTSPPLPRTGAPAELDISSSGFGTGSTTLRLDGGRLHYRFVPWGERGASDSATIVPDSAAWAAFWAAAEQVGLRSWPRECANDGVVDGGGFSVDLTYGGVRLRRSTNNAWPGRNGRCDRENVTREVTTFFDAVRALIGRPFPGRAVAVAALPREGAPVAFRLIAGAFSIGTKEVTLRGDTLVVTHRPYSFPLDTATTRTLIPTAEAWRTFWADMERAGIRYWPSECVDRSVLDGAGYQLDLTVPNGRIETLVVNASPSASGECVRGSVGAAPDLGVFLTGMGRLLGQPRFP